MGMCKNKIFRMIHMNKDTDKVFRSYVFFAKEHKKSSKTCH